jgi:hypothetical protein
MEKSLVMPKFLPTRVSVHLAWRGDKNLDNLIVKPFENVEGLME